MVSVSSIGYRHFSEAQEKKLWVVKNLIDLGYYVVPMYSAAGKVCSCRAGDTCKHPGKHPRTKNGRDDATNDLSVFVSLAPTHPNYNLAIATREGVIVTDFDDIDVLDQYKVQHKDLFDAPTVRTSKGIHVYHQTLTSFEGHNHIRILPGIDIRADGDLATVPDSIHYTGTPYTWIIPLVEKKTLPQLPSWYEEKLIKQGCKKKITQFEKNVNFLAEWKSRTYKPGEYHKAIISLAGHLSRKYMGTFDLKSLYQEAYQLMHSHFTVAPDIHEATSQLLDIVARNLKERYSTETVIKSEYQQKLAQYRRL